MLILGMQKQKTRLHPEHKVLPQEVKPVRGFEQGYARTAAMAPYVTKASGNALESLGTANKDQRAWTAKIWSQCND